MISENWEFRREAMRCSDAAAEARTAAEQRMLKGFARFYAALAEQDVELPTAAPNANEWKDRLYLVSEEQ